MVKSPITGISCLFAHASGIRKEIKPSSLYVLAAIMLAIFFSVTEAMGAKVIETAKFITDNREYKLEVVRYEMDIDGKDHQDVLLKAGLFQIWKFSDYITVAIPQEITFTVNSDSNNGVFAIVQQWAASNEVYYFKFDGVSVTRYLKGDQSAYSASTSSIQMPPPSTTPSQSAIDTIAPRDVVTGKRTLNFESENDEIARANSQSVEILSAARQASIAVNTDAETLEKLRIMLNTIARVTHRPNLPWEVFLIEDKQVNAFTIGGGKVFVFRGLLGGLVSPHDINELAAVIAHEAAHVTCKHVGKRTSMHITSLFDKKLRGKMYTASYTTLQEDEADRVGLLYMALAGYNPDAAATVWARAHGKYGSSPGDYTYDHSLNIDRMNKIKSLLPVARKYYRGQGVVNPDYDKILAKNDLIERTESIAGDSEFLKTVEGVSGTLVDVFQAKTEEVQRKSKKAANSMAVMQSVRIVHSNISNTADGFKGVFGRIQNIGSRIVQDVELTVYYYNISGKIIFSDPVPLGNINLQPFAFYDFGAYLKNIPGSQNVKVGISNGTFAQ